MERRGEVQYSDLGVLDYGACWDLQRQLFDEALRRKACGESAEQHLLLVEHPAVYTLGKSGKEGNLLVNEEYLKSVGASLYHIDRGGDITFHGEGQLVGYPILDLEQEGIGLREYIHLLEQSVIDTVAEWGIIATRVAGAAGVWITEEANEREGVCESGEASESVNLSRGAGGASRGLRKICAIGVRSSRYVTMHGFALNVNTDLKWFDYINPCGFTDRGVSSIAQEVGRQVAMREVKERFLAHFSKNLNVKIKY